MAEEEGDKVSPGDAMLRSPTAAERCRHINHDALVVHYTLDDRLPAFFCDIHPIPENGNPRKTPRMAYISQDALAIFLGSMRRFKPTSSASHCVCPIGLTTMDLDKLKRMSNANAVRTGGKGTVRR